MTALNLAGTYRRTVAASLARIRENVLDWEHLPALHASSFAACELIDEDEHGWRIRLANHAAAATPQILKLHIATDTSHYRVTTESGPGTPSEIRVTVTPHGAHETGVVVEYHVPETDPARLELIGMGFVAIYKHLWDEDEAMMQAREAALTPRVKAPTHLDLGPESGLQLPHDFDFGTHSFRLIRHNGTLLAHSRTCPHWLGPIDGPPDAENCLTCPWHGYRFNALTGHSADGRSLRLAPPPQIMHANGHIIVSSRA